MSTACRLILVRHGETAWNVERRLQGHIDSALNDRGERQADAVGRALADEPLAAIHASDLQRAARTAEAIASRHPSLEIQFDPALRERNYGAFEGLRIDELAGRFPAEMKGWDGDVLTLVPPQGEPVREFHARIAAAIGAIAERHVGQTVCIVAHGGVMDVAYRLAAGVAYDAAREWSIANAGINRLTVDAGRFSLLSWGETAHLDTIA